MPHCPSYEEMEKLDEALGVALEELEKYPDLKCMLSAENVKLVRAMIADNRQMRKYIIKLQEKANKQPPAPKVEVERRAPCQGEWPMRPAGTITWSEHLEAYAVYLKLYPGSSQSAERIAERGGFGYYEMTKMLGREPKTWKPHEVR